MSLPKWKARNFVVTIPSRLVKKKTLLKRLEDADKQAHFVRFVQTQLEPYESGKMHWQMYVETTGSQQADRVLKWLAPTTAHSVNIEERKGSRSDARFYCMKDADGRYDETWNWPGHKGRPKGSKTYQFGHWKPDVNSRKLAIVKLNQAIDTAKTFDELINNDDVSGTLKTSMNYARARYNAKAAPKQEGVQLRAWQVALMNELVTTPNDRKIIWYVDEDGGKGKTFMSRFLYANHGAAILGGRGKDMFYAYKNEKIVIFDLSRAATGEDGQVWDFDYEAMESIKDGLFFNTKYESGARYREEPAHVIVFANGWPLMDKLSLDRWDIRLCDVGTPLGGVAVITHDAVPVPENDDSGTQILPNIDKPPSEWYW